MKSICWILKSLKKTFYLLFLLITYFFPQYNFATHLNYRHVLSLAVWLGELLAWNPADMSKGRVNQALGN